MTSTEIKRIQGIVGTTQDGIMGPKTKAAIKAYQSKLGVTADGIWGPNTEKAYLNKTNPTSTSKPTNQSYPSTNTNQSTPTTNTTTTVKTPTSTSSSMTKDEIKRIQGIVGVTQDGIIGPKTTAAIKAYQTKLGVTSDGLWGKNTEKAYQTKINSGDIPSTPTPPTSTTPKYYDENTGFLTEEGTNAGMPEVNAPNPPTPTNTSLGTPGTSYYGNPRDQVAEQPAITETNYISDFAGDAGLVSSSYLKTISSDPKLMAFYVNALTYGGYQIGDVLNDMKRRELASKGNKEALTLKIIDPQMDRETYQATPEGQKAISSTASIIPTFNLQGLMNPEILKYGSNMPEELFQTLVPLQDRDSQEFKDAVANVKSAYWDLANAQLQAGTEQEKAVADYNYAEFKKQVERNYGIKLSDDATKAWAQIEGLENTYAGKNIQGSGLEAEAIDDVLKDTRKADQELRKSKLTEEESKMAAVYTASATPAQIKALIDEDKAKGLPRDQWRATKWGLVPSEEILAQYDMAELRKKYPDQSDEELQALRDKVLDENGNYRSTLYKKYAEGVATNKENQKTAAEALVEKDALNKEATAYKDYDASTAFLGQTATGNIIDPKTGLEETATPETPTPENPTPQKPTSQNPAPPTPTPTTPTAPKTTSTSTTSSNLRVGSSGAAVTALQKQLIAAGANITADGKFGPLTEAAVKAYQTKMGLTADGIVGPLTYAKLGTSSTPVNQSYPKTSTPPVNQSYPTTTTKTSTPTVNQSYPTTTKTSTPALNYTPAPVVKSSTPTVTAPTNTYKIASGDTLSKIAANLGTTVSALAAKNNITDINKIKAGATLKY